MTVYLHFEQVCVCLCVLPRPLELFSQVRRRLRAERANETLTLEDLTVESTFV